MTEIIKNARPRIYIAGPYSDPDPVKCDNNIKRASFVTAELIIAGWAPFCPHNNTAHFEHVHPDIPYEAYIGLDLAWAECAQCALFLLGHKKSDGSRIEKKYFRTAKIPIIYHNEPYCWSKLEKLRRKLCGEEV